jgi:hypothetical protein
MHQDRDVHHVDTAADIVVPEHDEALAQFQARLLGEVHCE